MWEALEVVFVIGSIGGIIVLVRGGIRNARELRHERAHRRGRRWRIKQLIGRKIARNDSRRRKGEASGS